MTKPRILVIENSIALTGALKSITRTANDLKNSFDFCFVLPVNSSGRFWIEGKSFHSVFELPMLEISRKIRSMLFYLPQLLLNAIRLNKIIKKEKIDLMHVNDIYNLLPVVHHLLGGSTPYVCHIRFLPDRFPKVLFTFWIKLHLRYAGKIIVVSNAVLKQLHIHPKIILIHNELPVEDRYPQLLNEGNDQLTFTFLYLSNFIEGKGQNFALEAFARIHFALPSWKLRFVGGDMGLHKNKIYRNALQERAKELGIFEKIEWMPFTEEVEWEYKQADIVLNFSESESFSITCVEALYFGRPLIATACGGPSEILDHGLTGLLVENRNIYAMSDAMQTMAQDSKLRKLFTTNARQSVIEKFSVERTSAKLGNEYTKLLCKS